jgi:glycosyltransferase involved in cell wall biosynthesis
VRGYPLCSVIIPSYQASATIRSCLTSVAAQDFSLPYEVIVVDSSSDGTGEIIRGEFGQVRLVSRKQRTDPALARNIGAREAHGEVLVFIDSDCTAGIAWLSGLYQAVESGYPAAGGSIVNGNGESLVSWAGYCCEFREFFPTRQAGEVENLTLGNAAYQRDAFWQAGGFPEGCFPQEDQVFHHAFRRCGYRIWFDPTLAVAHSHRTRLDDFLQHQRQIGRANAAVVQKLGLPGVRLAGAGPWRWLVLPAAAALRWVRTLWASRSLPGKVWRKLLVAFYIGVGMLFWGIGFMEHGGK